MNLNIKIKTGCDLVDLRKFRKVLDKGGEKFLSKVFTEHELLMSESVESRAGIFAVKEAVTKALNLKNDFWKKIEISKDKRGKPMLNLTDINLKILSQDISISHDGNYALACCSFLIES
ncbi:holo-ACP synthase [Patescibacteria group bacterium]